MNENFNWPPLESDPEIFSKFCRILGLPSNFRFTEILSLDYKGIKEIPDKVYGVILAYQTGNKPLHLDSSKIKDSSFTNFYMKQTI